ncbi:MAG: hypothetical protein IT370_20020 [Deltaproteobacteria bacterium]|nr:hypothetical protein [Deltaproteobacteria bacterium]
MGLFDFLKKKKKGAAPEPEPEPDTSSVEAEPVAVVVLRAGMTDPDDAYCDQILREHFPEALERALPVKRLSQPRWFKSEHLQSGLRLLARAMAPETGTDPGAATWITCAGPDGAPAALVFLRP